MSYQMIQQENGRTQYVSLENGEDSITVTSARVNINAMGYKIPGARINLLTQQSLLWTPPGCVDSCTAPAILPRTVRVIISGPTASKADLILMLQDQIAMLQSSAFDSVWLGFNPTPGNITFPVA